MKSKCASGFTLIELMIVVVIVAILASIALPSYQDYVRRAKLRESTVMLSDMRIRFEQYFQDNRSYGNGCDPAGITGPVAVTGDNFSIACVSGATTFTVTANSLAGRGLGNGAAEYAYTINQANARVTTTFKNVASGKNCWLVRGDEC